MRNHLEAVGHAAAFDYIMYTPAQYPFLRTGHSYAAQAPFQEDTGRTGQHLQEKPCLRNGFCASFPCPEEVPDLMKKFVEQAPRWKEMYHPVEYAARLHQRLVAIHPFVDGNGRVSRLLMNLARFRAVIWSPSFPRPLLGIHRDSGDLPSAHDTFYPVICRCQIEAQKEYLRQIKLALFRSCTRLSRLKNQDIHFFSKNTICFYDDREKP